MAKPRPAPTDFSTHAFGADLHQFLEQYEAAYPQEVLHIEEPLRRGVGDYRAGDEARKGAALSHSRLS